MAEPTHTVVDGSRGKMITLTLLAAMFALGNWLIRDELIAEGGLRALVGYLGPLFWLACGGIGLFRSIYPPTLTLSAEGFTADWRLGRPKLVSWSEIDNFYLRKMGLATKMVGYAYRRPARIEGAFPVGGRSDGTLSDQWTLTPEQLLALLQDHLEASRR